MKNIATFIHAAVFMLSPVTASVPVPSSLNGTIPVEILGACDENSPDGFEF